MLIPKVDLSDGVVVTEPFQQRLATCYTARTPISAHLNGQFVLPIDLRFGTYGASEPLCHMSLFPKVIFFKVQLCWSSWPKASRSVGH